MQAAGAAGWDWGLARSWDFGSAAYGMRLEIQHGRFGILGITAGRKGNPRLKCWVAIPFARCFCGTFPDGHKSNRPSESGAIGDCLCVSAVLYLFTISSPAPACSSIFLLFMGLRRAE